MANVNGQMRADARTTAVAGLMRSALASNAGLMEFNDDNTATDGLMLFNNTVAGTTGLPKIKGNG